ncbi:hypothetical protein M731_03765 [Neisseria gonorrhoeae ATL_2011_01-25]|uniref:Uncharacterized protein n=1 Tax=Neisseria gonorrhoeae 3502 TaxID=1193404 RepID=A0AA44UAU1_NEIGO|nr:hypothetical protein M675_08685 [Neisseria gonorrhoeae SK1902]KLR98045.1 hypothetical protein M674_10595 [Neisseria gonorrhoeae SK708]KLS03358.1 hypothetical protein M688_08980 [Neisseria gonorrhoeae SK22871]KLS20975.1 hypothetical protein M731_03765 [Neisseria gonorrhoeae ATL_2011_01-25]KLS27402.1 hypothetical protein M737_02440 [Neisseria gonorrhoeae MIA_2011_05-10]KLS27569.1 hypothetical protein M722_07060 [Neisseria gonorrhoeae ALB_2011_04_03]KLS32776.1 hypothetical protein M721_06920 
MTIWKFPEIQKQAKPDELDFRTRKNNKINKTMR